MTFLNSTPIDRPNELIFVEDSPMVGVLATRDRSRQLRVEALPSLGRALVISVAMNPVSFIEIFVFSSRAREEPRYYCIFVIYGSLI